jgi:hypothetical protein
MKICTAKKAAGYLREWSGRTAVKKESADAGFIYFTCKDSKGAAEFVRVDIHSQGGDDEGGAAFNCYTRDDLNNWQWFDAIPADSESGEQ